jgi:tripartite-type tricarboxylate transporter receptor subunit TctC
MSSSSTDGTQEDAPGSARLGRPAIAHALRGLIIGLAGVLLALPDVGAQDWPSRPIRLVIPYAAGNTGDIAFRIVAPALEARLGQRFVIDNKAGASGNIGAQDVVRAAPDGHTLLLGATNNFVVNQFVYRAMDFDPLEALVPVTMLSDAPSLVIVAKGAPWQSLRDLQAEARTHPGRLNFGSPGAGTPPHLAAELFSQLAGIQMVHVPFKGSPAAVLALLANEVQVYVTALGSVEGNLRADKLRALAVASKRRLSVLPDVPTTAEAGFPDLLTGNWWGLAAPRGIDPRVIERLAGAVKAVLDDPAVQRRYAALGMDVGGQTPAAFATQLRDEAARWKRVLERAGVTPE